MKQLKDGGAVLILLATASLELLIPPQRPLTGLTLSETSAAVKHDVYLLKDVVMFQFQSTFVFGNVYCGVYLGTCRYG